MASAVLRVRDENGNVTDITSIKGADGKSAYQYAVQGGYKKSESEFYNDLSNVGNVLTRPKAQKEFFRIETDGNYDVDFGFWTQTSGNNWWFYAGFFYKHPDFPEGTEIADFEVVIPGINNNEYISLNNLIPFDEKPYIPMVKQVYHSKNGSCILQQIYNLGSSLHLVLQKLEGFEWESARITYYTD
jgi:hypothetical protein